MSGQVKLNLTSKGHYGETHTNVSRPVTGIMLDYLDSDGSIAAKNRFVNSLCDIDIQNYPTGDREYIFASLRSLVSNTQVNGVFKCKKEGCTGSVVYMLDIATCKVSTLPDDFERDFKHTFPISKEVRTLNILTCAKEELVENYLSLYAVSDLDLANSDLGDNLAEMARLAALFNESYDINSLDANIQFLKGADWADLESLILYDISFETGPNILTHAECDECKKKYKVRVKSDSSFFGLNMNKLISRHSFLARSSGIGFSDFKSYTLPVLDVIVDGEITRIREANAKTKAAIAKRKAKK